MEENYYEIQFQENYYKDFNRLVAPNFEFDDKGEILKINTPLNIDSNEKNILLMPMDMSYFPPLAKAPQELAVPMARAPRLNKGPRSEKPG